MFTPTPWTYPSALLALTKPGDWGSALSSMIKLWNILNIAVHNRVVCVDNDIRIYTARTGAGSNDGSLPEGMEVIGGRQNSR